MVTVCHPVDDIELLFLRSALEAVDIPYFVIGQHFGSLYPGIQIPAYNERTIRVPPAYKVKALEVIAEVRSTYEPACVNLTVESKFRMFVESMLGWVIPAGTKRSLSK